MKFFKRDLYDLMGLTELSLFRDEKNIKKYWKQSYEEEFKGKEDTYKKAILEIMPEMKNQLGKDEYLYTVEGPSDVLKNKIPEIVSTFHNNWEVVCAEYNDYYRQISSALPTSMLEFNKRSIHDSVILNIEQNNKDELLIELDGTLSCYDCYRQGNFKILFEGVKKVEIPEILDDRTCLYEEVHLSEEAKFDYMLLLESGEIRVVADHIQVIY